MIKQFSIRHIDFHDLDKIFHLLQDLSNFYPHKTDFNTIWEKFIAQKNVYGFVVIENKTNNLVISLD